MADQADHTPNDALPSLMLHDWVTTHGACVGTMPAQTDPDPHFDDRLPRGRHSRQRQRERARAACTGCAVQSACLELALRHERATGHSWGVWGATSPAERQALIAAREHCDDVADDVVRVLSALHGADGGLDSLPTALRAQLVALGLVLVYHLRDEQYLLPQIVLTAALSSRARA